MLFKSNDLTSWIDNREQVHTYEIEGEVFNVNKDAREAEGFLGFFDWLRSSPEKIVGVRLCFLDNLEFIKLFEQRVSTFLTFNNRCVEIFFTKADYDRDLSGDQDFSRTFLYQSPNGNLLLTLPVDCLNDVERQSLHEYGVQFKKISR